MEVAAIIDAYGWTRKADVVGVGELVSGVTHGQGQPNDLRPGEMVGEYRVDQQIGEGGMGKVYSATHPVIAKRAAIKILHPELSMNREAVERFIQEARSVNQIGHPNIVDIFSFGTLPDGRCYFVMEWLRGESLRDRLRGARIPLGEALAFIDTIAVALEGAHEKGIVHRDLKPDNIYLCDVRGSSPQVKLLDFGIAKLLSDDGRMERTRTGNLMGTPAYMSPEQARGHQVDHRTDIYALGCVAYEMFTGSLPFPADNAADMIAKHLYEQPPSAQARNPHLPAELDALTRYMLGKDPNTRPTLAQVRDQIRRAQQMVASQAYGAHVAAPGYGNPQQHPSNMGPQMTPGVLPQMTPGVLPQMTPGMMPSGMPTYTPAPGTMSAMGTGMPVAKKPKTGLIAILALAAVGISVTVIIMISQKGGGDGEGSGSAADTVPRPDGTQPTKPADTIKPADTTATDTKPAETAKPAETTTATETTEPADTTKPADTTATDTTKPTDTTAVVPDAKKPTKKPAKKPTRKPTKKPGPGDDDAPM